MKRRLVATIAAVTIGLGAPTAQAAMIVYDPTSYAKLIQQAKTALDQLTVLKSQVQQGQQLFDSLNEASGVGRIGSQLSQSALRDFLPEVNALAAAAKGDLQSLGAIGGRAQSIRDANRLYTATTGDIASADIEAAGQRAARDLALGEAVTTAGARRLDGLKALQQSIDTAPNARAVLDLQARAATEQAKIHDRCPPGPGQQTQRERERMLAAREARMASYQRGFQ